MKSLEINLPRLKLQLLKGKIHNLKLKINVCL